NCSKVICLSISTMSLAKYMDQDKIATYVNKPPTNPPPGELCPAKNKYIAKPNKINTIKLVVVFSIRLFISIVKHSFPYPLFHLNIKNHKNQISLQDKK